MDGRLSVSQDKITLSAMTIYKAQCEADPKLLVLCPRLTSGHLSDLARACTAGGSASRYLLGDRDKRFAI